MKILYVEDNKINAIVMKKILDDHELDIAYTGSDGVSVAASVFFDIVLLDINLGSDEMDGCGVLRRLRTMEVYRSIPIFAITAYALPQDKTKFLEVGFDDYFSKPVDYAKLQAKIKEVKQL